MNQIQSHDRSMARNAVLGLAALALLLTLAPALQAAAPDVLDNGRIAEVRVKPGSIEFLPVTGYTQRQLTVSGCGLNLHYTFKQGENPVIQPFDDFGERLLDGEYTYELVLQPEVDGSIREILDRARAEGDERTIWELRRDGKLPQAAVQTGYFQVIEGSFFFTEATEPERQGKDREVDGLNQVVDKAQIISPDGVVYNSLCVGFDCPNNPSFSFDTIRLQENNLRIHFDDTSTAGSYPRTDWRLIANDSTNGGASKFAIQDASANREVFVVEANARTNALYVDDGGRVGLGTSTPSVEMHMTDGDTPTLRLDQTTASGFAAQRWDLAGNETSFFVRDATNGSTLPFRIRPGSPSNALTIDTDGDVGVGTLTSDAPLHVKGSDGSTQVLIEETSGTVAGRTVLQLVNNGNVQFMLMDSDTGDQWQFSALTASDLFQVSKLGTDLGKFRVKGAGGLAALVGNDNIFDLTAAGDLTIDGTLTELSDRDSKENFQTLDRQEVLEKVLQLPVTTWNYKDNDPSVRHMGPMAQDFHAAFGLGATDKGMASLDVNGVTLVALQGAAERLEQKEQEIEELKARMAELEALVRTLAAQQ